MKMEQKSAYLLGAGVCIFGIIVLSIMSGDSTAQAHHDRVAGFYGTIITDYHEYNGGYLTYGLWRTAKGEELATYKDAAENLYTEVADRIHMDGKSTVLDVACGMASQDVYLFRKYGANITAVDLTPQHVKIGNQRLKKIGLEDKIRLLEGSATDLPFPNKTFSHVFCIEGLPHFHTREDFFRETYRVLKPGGVFGYSDVTLQSMPGPSNFLATWFIRATAYLWTVSQENFYDNEEYVNKLKRLGFKDVKLTHHNREVYYQYQQNSYADREMLYPVRGFIMTWASLFLDYLLRKLSDWDWIDYILVTGTRPL